MRNKESPALMAWRAAEDFRVNMLVPGSMLQEVPGTMTLMGGVADDVAILMR